MGPRRKEIRANRNQARGWNFARAGYRATGQTEREQGERYLAARTGQSGRVGTSLQGLSWNGRRMGLSWMETGRELGGYWVSGWDLGGNWAAGRELGWGNMESTWSGTEQETGRGTG